MSLIAGLMNAGVNVHDIGLAISPMAYFAQFHLNCAGVAMVTASHNSNGWTGVKMGIEAPLTFGPDEMSRLKEIVLEGQSVARQVGVTAMLMASERPISKMWSAMLNSHGPFALSRHVVTERQGHLRKRS